MSWTHSWKSPGRRKAADSGKKVHQTDLFSSHHIDIISHFVAIIYNAYLFLKIKKIKNSILQRCPYQRRNSRSKPAVLLLYGKNIKYSFLRGLRDCKSSLNLIVGALFNLLNEIRTCQTKAVYRRRPQRLSSRVLSWCGNDSEGGSPGPCRH